MCNSQAGRVGIQNALCKVTVTHSELCMTRTQCVCTEAENGAKVATVKSLGLMLRHLTSIYINN